MPFVNVLLCFAESHPVGFTMFNFLLPFHAQGRKNRTKQNRTEVALNLALSTHGRCCQDWPMVGPYMCHFNVPRRRVGLGHGWGRIGEIFCEKEARSPQDGLIQLWITTLQHPATIGLKHSSWMPMAWHIQKNMSEAQLLNAHGVTYTEKHIRSTALECPWRDIYRKTYPKHSSWMPMAWHIQKNISEAQLLNAHGMAHTEKHVHHVMLTRPAFLVFYTYFWLFLRVCLFEPWIFRFVGSLKYVAIPLIGVSECADDYSILARCVRQPQECHEQRNLFKFAAAFCHARAATAKRGTQQWSARRFLLRWAASITNITSGARDDGGSIVFGVFRGCCCRRDPCKQAAQAWNSGTSCYPL